MKTRIAALALIASCLAPFTYAADDYDAAFIALCEKKRTCTIAEMEASNAAPEHKARARQMMAGMCQIETSVPLPTGYEALRGDAAACLRSQANLSCTDLETDAVDETAACKSFWKKAERR